MRSNWHIGRLSWSANTANVLNLISDYLPVFLAGQLLIETLLIWSRDPIILSLIKEIRSFVELRKLWILTLHVCIYNIRISNLWHLYTDPGILRKIPGLRWESNPCTPPQLRCDALPVELLSGLRGLVAQLVEHHTGYVEVWVRFPPKCWNFSL